MTYATIEVSLDEYELTVEVHSVTDVKGDPSTWDSDWDYYGYREIEFDVVSGGSTDEGGNETELTKEQLAKIQNKYCDIIEQKLWDYFEGMNDED